MNTTPLSYDYGRGPGLPRREFVVDVELGQLGGDEFQPDSFRSYSVTGPDPVTSVNVVRRTVLKLVEQPGRLYQVVQCREVEQVYDPERSWTTRPVVTLRSF